MTETVRRKFDKINDALYEGKTTGVTETDRECNEWSSNFPHFEWVSTILWLLSLCDFDSFSITCRVRGHHLLDTWDDGTEIAEPDPFVFVSDSLLEDLSQIWCTNEWVKLVLEQKLRPSKLKEINAERNTGTFSFCRLAVVGQKIVLKPLPDMPSKHTL